MGVILVKSMLIRSNDITTDIDQIVVVSVKDEVLIEGDQVVISEDGEDEIDIVLSIYPDGTPKLANRIVSDSCIVRKILAGENDLSPRLISTFRRCIDETIAIDECFRL
jgi:hypothetical protein